MGYIKTILQKVKTFDFLRIASLICMAIGLYFFIGIAVEDTDQNRITALLFGGFFYLGLGGFLEIASVLKRMNKRIVQLEQRGELET